MYAGRNHDIQGTDVLASKTFFPMKRKKKNLSLADC
jgi:hypothetical protein